jgi:hypothetical protein
MNLGKGTKVTRMLVATAVGATAVNGSILDMSGFEGVMFIGEFGAITDGTTGIKAQDGDNSALSDAADLAGSAVTEAITDDNKCVILDIFKPLKRYIRPVALRSGATGAVIDSIIAVQYSPRVKPTTHDASTVANYEVYASPSDGTA